MASHVKKGDMVQVIAGEHKGSTGKIIRLDSKKQQVIVEGINRRYKHVRPSRKNPQGGRLQIEQPIHISNVLPLSPKSNKAGRVHYEIDAKGNKKRMSIDGTELSVVSRA
jgi:large subunit ribosomal protein L24